MQLGGGLPAALAAQHSTGLPGYVGALSRGCSAGGEWEAGDQSHTEVKNPPPCRSNMGRPCLRTAPPPLQDATQLGWEKLQVSHAPGTHPQRDSLERDPFLDGLAAPHPPTGRAWFGGPWRRIRPLGPDMGGGAVLPVMGNQRGVPQRLFWVLPVQKIGSFLVSNQIQFHLTLLFQVGGDLLQRGQPANRAAPGEMGDPWALRAPGQLGVCSPLSSPPLSCRKKGKSPSPLRVAPIPIDSSWAWGGGLLLPPVASAPV